MTNLRRKPDRKSFFLALLTVVGIAMVPAGSSYATAFYPVLLYASAEVNEQTKEENHVVRGWLGVWIQEVTSNLAESFGLDHPKGAIILETTEGSPADKSGLEIADIILKFNGREVEDSDALPPMIGQVKPGETVEVEVLRDGKRKTLEVTLGQFPEDGAPMVQPSEDDEKSLE